jgi:hypothetical protein
MFMCAPGGKETSAAILKFRRPVMSSEKFGERNVKKKNHTRLLKKQTRQ